MGEQLAQSRQNLLLCANLMRREAKLCDIVLYVQNKRGLMVGYPAHKLVLINSSRYFKGLFERESLQQYCHFPSLTEDGLFTLLDIIYGHDISPDVKIEDALYAAKYLQVESAVDFLENALLQQVQVPVQTRMSHVIPTPSRSQLPHSDNTNFSSERTPRPSLNRFSPTGRKRSAQEAMSPVEPKRELMASRSPHAQEYPTGSTSSYTPAGTGAENILDTLKGLTSEHQDNESGKTMVIKVESDEDIYGDDQDNSMPGMMGSFAESRHSLTHTDTSHSVDSGGESLGGMDSSLLDFKSGLIEHGPVIDGLRRCGICGLDIDINMFIEHERSHSRAEQIEDFNSPSYNMRGRTSFTSSQLAMLEREFQVNKYITNQRRSAFAALLGLSEQNVRSWFKNRRAKYKKSMELG